jgi:hypothetical protein
MLVHCEVAIAGTSVELIVYHGIAPGIGQGIGLWYFAIDTPRFCHIGRGPYIHSFFRGKHINPNGPITTLTQHSRIQASFQRCTRNEQRFGT